MLTRRRFVASGLALPLALLACGRDDEGDDVAVSTTAPATATAPALTATVSARTATATSTPMNRLNREALAGFAFPIAGACLPASDNLMPNAPRTYRRGVHEGVDFYPGLACAAITRGTPVLAMLDGTVTRADLDYEELTAEVLQRLRAETARAGVTPPDVLDIYRGRQVWVDHGQGVVTRYCHLGSIAPGIERGVRVSQGQHLGGVGESGTPESIEAPGTEVHLHAEVRIAGSFLGADLDPVTVRSLYARLFGGA